MSVARDASPLAGQILGGDVASLRPALTRGLAGRLALRLEPDLALASATTAADARRLVLATHAGAIAALLSALRGPLDESVPARTAGALAGVLGSQPPNAPAETAIAAAAAAAAEDADVLRCLDLALAGAGAPDAAVARLALAAMQQDFQEFQAATLRTPIARLLARPLWPPTLRSSTQSAIDGFQARLKQLGLHTLNDEYRRLVDGKLPDADELNDALVAALDEASPLPPEDSAARVRAARTGRSRKAARSRQADSPGSPAATDETGQHSGARETVRVTMPGRGTVDVPVSLISHDAVTGEPLQMSEVQQEDPAAQAVAGTEAPQEEPAAAVDVPAGASAATGSSSGSVSAAPASSSDGAARPVERATRVPLSMFSDEPLADERADVLDFRPYADALAGLITDPTTATPLTLAINAPWGAGKSTLARMVRRRLENSASERSGLPHVTCWFDSWAHDDADDLTGAFVATIAQSAAAQRPLWRRLLMPVPKALLMPAARGRRRLHQAVVVLLLIVSAATLLVWSGAVKPSLIPSGFALPGPLATTLLVAITALLALRELLKAATTVGDFIRDPKAVAATGSVNAVRHQLSALIRQATRGDRRFVAFIDDLERCRPPRPVELLEVVNQLLPNPNVVTVILADMPAVAACVEIKYKDLAERYRPSGTGATGHADARQAYGRLYLQKIVQLQFDMPPHTPDRIRSFVSKLLAPAAPPAAPAATARAGRVAAALGAVSDQIEGVANAFTGFRQARRARSIRAQAEAKLSRGTVGSADELLQGIAVPSAMAPTARNIAREAVYHSLVQPGSDVWQVAEEEALRHVPPLPRNAKRLINRLRLLIFVAQERGMFAAHREETARRIGKWAVMCERWPELAGALGEDASLIGRLEVAARDRTAEFFAGMVEKVAPAHARDEALQPFLASEPGLGAVLSAVLHMDADPRTTPTADQLAPTQPAAEVILHPA